MNIKLSAFVAVSLDGYIARLNGKLDWLTVNSKKTEAEDFGYYDFLATVDCVVMGRHSFEKAVAFPEWPFHRKRVVVVSRTWNKIPDEYLDYAQLYSGKMELLTVELQNQGVKRVYVHGGITVHSFIQAKCLTDITITHVPVILGSGIPLFGPTRDDVHFDLVRNKSFDSGFVQSVYQLKQ